MTQATSSPEYTTRLQDITQIWKDNRWLYALAGILIGILVTPSIEQITGDLQGLIGNLVPEAVGIVFTVLIVDRLAANRSTEELKTRLLHEVKSPANGIAVNALNWLRREAWIDTATFKEQSMVNVNWEGAYIGGLNFDGAMLYRANFKSALSNSTPGDISDVNPVNLSGTYLREANLQEADLSQANFSAAHMRATNLTYANLEGANLNAARLWETNFSGARLRQASLRDAKLEGTIFDEQTVLPDAELVLDEQGNYVRDEGGNRVYTKYWTPDTDMTRYTDPQHPDFWEPEWARQQPI